MKTICLDDLKSWRAHRIAGGCCSFDDMEALNGFIETARTIELVTCENCAHGQLFPRCSGLYWCKMEHNYHRPGFYCADAERREL